MVKELTEDNMLVAKLVAEKIRSGDFFLEFEGHQHCPEDKPCYGWDGFSHMCMCRNSRVRWVLSNEKDRIYAVAY